MSTLRIARRNLGRNTKRTALALFAIALSQTAVLLMDGLLRGYSDTMVDAFTGPMLGHVQVHAPDYRTEQSMDLTLRDLDAKLTRLRVTPGVESATARIYAPALLALGEQGYAGVVVGIDPARERGARGLLGDDPDAAAALGRGEVVLGAGLARQMKATLGDTLAVVGQGVDGSIANDLVRVAGVLTSPVEVIQSTGLLMDLHMAQTLFAMPDEAHEITLHGADPALAGGLAQRIAGVALFANTEVEPWDALAPELTTMLDLTDFFSWVLLLLVFVAAAAGIANTMLMATFERNHELGMLLALGCSPPRIVAMITLEALLLGLFGIALGTAAGVTGTAVLAQSGIDLTRLAGAEALQDLSFGGMNYSAAIVPRTSLLSVLGGVGAVAVTAVLASLWPALHAARLQPVEAMRT